MARLSKLTPEVEERIVRAIRAGRYPEVAARYRRPSAPTAASEGRSG
jgi:hypothetical protein